MVKELNNEFKDVRYVDDSSTFDFPFVNVARVNFICSGWGNKIYKGPAEYLP